jgi:hypothetical protein
VAIATVLKPNYVAGADVRAGVSIPPGQARRPTMKTAGLPQKPGRVNVKMPACNP